MKKSYLAAGVLLALNFALTLVLVSFMPDEVPAHFNMSGEVDRLGSRYEVLMMPFIGAGVGLLLFLLVKFGDEGETKALGRVNVITQLAMVAVSAAWSSAILFAEGIQVGYVLAKATAVVLGVFLLALGNAMPKANINAIFGLRTFWSMSSEQVWQKSQRFGGYASIAAGSVLAVCGVVLDGVYIGGLVVGVVLVWGVACIAASYKIYRDDRANL